MIEITFYNRRRLWTTKVLPHRIKWFGHPRKFQDAKIRYASVNALRTFSVLPVFRYIGEIPKVDCGVRHVAIFSSVRTEQLPLLRIFWILIFEDFLKNCRENSIRLKSYNTNVYFIRRSMYIYGTMSLNSF